mgnify:CR=1 FL=1
MALVQKFNNVTTKNIIKINDLITSLHYKVLKAHKITTRFGETVTLCLLMQDRTESWVYLPKRYTSVFTQEEMDNINSSQTTIYLQYDSVCQKTNTYLLTLTSQ